MSDADKMCDCPWDGKTCPHCPPGTNVLFNGELLNHHMPNHHNRVEEARND